MRRTGGFFFSALCCSSLLGCGHIWSGAKPEPAAVPLESLELYLSRGSSTGTDFEQFKLSGDTLYKECGPVKRGRNYAAEQEVIPLPPEFRPRIDSAASVVMSELAAPNTALAKPGSSDGMFEPGRLTLSIKSAEGHLGIATSLDSVSEPEGSAEEKILRLVELVRSAAGLPFCGSIGFYGIKPVK